MWLSSSFTTRVFLSTVKLCTVPLKRMHLLAYWTDHVSCNEEMPKLRCPYSIFAFVPCSLFADEYTDASVWPLIFALISSFVCRKNLSCPISPHLMSIPLILPSKTFSGMLSWDISTGPSAVERNEWVRLNEWAESRHISLGEYPPFHFFPFILLVSASNHQAYLSTGYIIFFARYLHTEASLTLFLLSRKSNASTLRRSFWTCIFWEYRPIVRLTGWCFYRRLICHYWLSIRRFCSCVCKGRRFSRVEQPQSYTISLLKTARSYTKLEQPSPLEMTQATW